MKSKQGKLNEMFSQIHTIYKQEGLYSLIGSTKDYVWYNLIYPVIDIFLSLADRYRLINPDTIYKDKYYEKRKKDPWRSESNHIGEVLNERYKPESVIDFGCAIGTHLEPFYNKGVKIKGIEGNKYAIENSVVPSRYVVQHDLRDPFEPSDYYDLALSIEVAEHIPEEFSDIYADTIADSAERIVMTAAPPGQGGTHHVNEQTLEYWIQKFENRGFKFDQNETNKVASLFDVDNSTWMENNLLIFKKE